MGEWLDGVCGGHPELANAAIQALSFESKWRLANRPEPPEEEETEDDDFPTFKVHTGGEPDARELYEWDQRADEREIRILGVIERRLREILDQRDKTRALTAAPAEVRELEEPYPVFPFLRTDTKGVRAFLVNPDMTVLFAPTRSAGDDETPFLSISHLTHCPTFDEIEHVLKTLQIDTRRLRAQLPPPPDPEDDYQYTVNLYLDTDPATDPSIP